MKTTITKVAAVVMTFLLASFTTYADIVVTAPTLTLCPGTSTVSIAFTVTGAQNLGSISMKVSINHSVLYNTPFTYAANSALLGGFSTANVTANPPYVIAFAWFGTGAATIPDGQSMVTFTVPYLGGTSPLHFQNIGIDCVISDVNGNDLPCTWIDGSVGPVPTLAIDTQPQSLTVTQGNDAVFTVVPNIATTYQWQESSDGGTNWADLTEGAPYLNVTTASLTIAGVTAALDNYQYRCNITAPCTQSITSDPATLTVSTTSPLPVAFDMSGGGSICEGAPGISFGLSGSELDVTYELFLDGTGTGYVVNGTGNPLTFDNITAPGTYTIVGTNAYGSTTMNFFGVLVVNPLPVVTWTAVIPPVCSNAPAFALTGGLPEGGVYSGQGVDGGMFDASIAGAGVYNLVYTYTDANSCTSSDTNVVTVVLIEYFDVTGGGTFCEGGTGVSVGLSGSSADATYELYLDGVATGTVLTGTGSSLDFGLQATAGTYTVKATYSCGIIDMNLNAVVTAEAVPTIYTVSGGGSICAGAEGVYIYLSGSDNMAMYFIYNGGEMVASLAGDGNPLTFGPFTDPGTYTIFGEFNILCGINMSGSATIASNPEPTAFDVTGDTTLCSGGIASVTLSNSEVGVDAAGIIYYLYLDGVSTGVYLVGTGEPLVFTGLTDAGSYSVYAVSSCGTFAMNGSALIDYAALPVIFNVTGGGEICPGTTGIPVGLDASESGVNYELYFDGTATGNILAGTDSPLDFGIQMTAGSYTVAATNTCGSLDMAGSAVATLPDLIEFTTQPTDVTIDEGQSATFSVVTNISAQTQWQVSLDGGTIWTDLVEGAPYSGVNTSQLEITGATLAMNGYLFRCSVFTADCPTYTFINSNSALLTVNAVIPDIIVTAPSIDDAIAGNPVVVPVTVENVANVAAISLSLGFDPAVLTFNGYQNEDPQLLGGLFLVNLIGDHVKFGWFSITPINIASGTLIEYLFTFNGGYSDLTWDMTQGECQFTSIDPIILNAIYVNGHVTGTCPMPLAYAVTGGGSYCPSETGVGIGLENSESNATYELYLDGTTTGIILTGTGAALDFGLQSAAGIYTVVATNPCGSTDMTGSVEVIALALPTAYEVTGDAVGCLGDSFIISLSGSETGISYELYKDGVSMGPLYPYTLDPIEFTVTESGVYTIFAGNSCGSVQMNGSATISFYPSPLVFDVTGGGILTPSTLGLNVGLNGSEIGFTYELYLDGVYMGISLTGDGLSLDFGVFTTAGIYTVVAQYPCGSITMNGSAIIAEQPAIATTVTSPDGYDQLMVTGESYTHTLCSGIEITHGIPTLTSVLSDAFGTLRLQMVYTSTLPNIPSQTLDYTFDEVVMAGPQTISPENHTLVDQTINFVTIPYYDVDGSGSLTPGDVTGDPTNFLLTVKPALAITSNPVDVSVLEGGTADFTIAVNIAGVYQWEVSTDGGSTFTALTDDIYYSGTSTDHLTIGNIPSSFNGNQYRCGVYDAVCGISTIIYSSVATLTVTTPSIITVTAPSIDDAIEGNLVIVPITVENLVDVASISLSLGFDPAVLTYTGYQNLNPAISTNLLSINLLGNHVKFAWLDVVPVSILSGTLIEYLFTFNEGYSDLTWDLTPGECQFTDLTPTALAANFIDGHVTGTCPLPLVFNVTGGGSYCPAEGGVAVGLDGSELLTNYELFLEGVTTGTIITGDGNALSFGLMSAAGTYTVVATNNCGTSDMNGNAVVTPFTVPAVFTVSGSGTVCSGSAGINILLSGSEAGVTYELYQNGVATGNILPGTGDALDFGGQTGEGTYTVIASNVCGNITMDGSGVITLQPIIAITQEPVNAVVNVGEDALFQISSNIPGYAQWQVSTDGGSTFTDLVEAAPYSGVDTYILHITGASLDMNGYQYRCAVYDPVCGVSSLIYTNSALLTVNPLPVIITTAPSIDDAVIGNPVIVPITVENLNGVAAISLSLGFDPAVLTYVGLQNINPILDAGILSVNLLGSNVKLGWFSVTPISLATGTLIEYVFTFNGGYSPLTWDLTPGECEYDDISPTPLAAVFVDGHVTGGCVNPLAFDVTGGGTYCTGGTGVEIGLSGSETLTTYELFLDGVTTGYIMTGDGNALSFGNHTLTGTYTVVATNICGSTDMNGNAVISTYPLLATFDVTGGGSYCAGGAGVSLGLSGSENGIPYELFLDGSSTGVIITGDGNALDFGLQTLAGTYTVNASDICGIVPMTGNAVVIINAPVFNVFNVTGGGAYCAGGPGVSVGLDGSETQYNYELYLDGVSLSVILPGTGNALDFGVYNSLGTYTVVATDPCGSAAMSGNAVISTFPVPADYAVTGGGSYCSGGTGVSVGLSGSEVGFTYELYLDGVSTLNALAGNGMALDFGLQTAAGTYTVFVNYTCGSIQMTGEAVVTILTPLFTPFNVTGGGTYCSGAGLPVGLDGSETPYVYELYLDGVYTGTSLPGDGNALAFGAFSAPGTYTVKAVDICGSAFMTGNAVISLGVAPAVFTMTGGGSYCSGATGFAVGLSGSETGVTYELFLDGSTTGIIVPGDGNPITFGIQTAVGSYTSVAHGICEDVAMNGAALITTGATVTLYDVLGGGSYLAGGVGVEVSLSGSETDVNYQLLYNGVATGPLVPGTGAPISFGFQTLAGSYTVMAITYPNNCQQMMNGGATVVVIPVILSHPGDTAIFAGFGASFTVTALGATIYQWQISTDGGLTFTDIAEGNPFFNVNSTTLDIFGAPLSFSGYKFRCLVSSPGSPVIASNAGTLIVTVAPTLTTIAPFMTASPGTAIAVPITVLGFENVAAFNLTMNYDPTVMTPAGIQNENGALLTGSEIQFINTSIPGQFLMAYYSMVPVSIGSGTLLELLYNFVDGSTPLIWQLTPAEGAQYGTLFGQVIPSIWINGQINSTNSIVITDQPDNATTCEGGSVTYSVTAPGATTYQWVVTTDYGMTWIPLTESPMFVGVNTSSLVVNGVSSSMSNFMFACRIDQGLSTAVISNLASLNIVTYDVIPASIVAVPSNIICPGTNVTFSVSSPVDLTGASYIWYINSIPVSSAASFSTTTLADGDIVKVDVMLSATCVVAQVPTVTMVVDPQPVVTTDPVNAIVVVGDDPTFSVTATSVSGPVTYQWQLSTDGGLTFTDLTETPPYSGVTAATLQITDATLSMDGYQFRCIVTEGLCGNTDISGTAILYVFPAPIITYLPDVVVCNGEQIIVPITVDNFASVASMSLKLNFDPSVISYVGYQNTNILLTPPPPASYMLNIASTGNEVSIFWFSLTPTTIANGDLITELVFSPVTPGFSNLTWDMTFGSCMYTTITAIPIPDIYVDGSVTVNPLPVVYNVTGGGEYCIGGIGLEVGLDGSEVGINYELYLDGFTTGIIVAGTGSPITFGYQLLAGNYTVVGTNAITACVSNMAGLANIIINPLPVVTWTNALTTQCEASEVYVLTGGTPPGGTYSGPGVTGNNFNANEAGPGTHVLTYTYMDENGCVNFANNTITVLDGPDPFQVTGGGTFCQGGQGVTVGLANSEPVIIYQLFINGVNSGSPVFGTGGVINFGYQTIPGVYTVVGLNIFNGCTALMTGSVTVTEIVPNVTWPGSLPALCQNSSPYTLTGGLPAGGTYSGNGVIGGLFNPAIAGNGVHVLTYTYTDTYGCTGSATNTIVVNPGPEVTFSPLPDICLTASAFDLTTYVTPVGGTFSGTGVSGTLFNPTVAGVGAHIISYSYASNNCTVIINRSINVLPLPIVTWNNTLASQCVDVTGYFLSGGTPAGGVYSGTGVTGNVFNPSLAGVGTHTLTYTYTDGNGCINSATNTIVVNALPIVTWSTVLPDQCVNLTTFALTGGTPAGGVYSGPGVSGTNFNPNLAGIGIHTLTYTYTDINGCVNSITNTITVTPVPEVTFNTLPDVCYNAQPLPLSPFVTPVGGTFSGTGVTGNTFDPAVAGIGIHTITYSYTLNGCTVIVSRNIHVVPAPNVTWATTLPAQCEDVTAYYLDGGSPAGGFYSGPGVVGNLFNPSLVGPGTYTLLYTFTDPGSGCTGSVTNTIVVNPLPTVVWSTVLDDVCIDGSVVTLSGASPAGGTYSGTAVIGTSFNPAVAGVGTFTITYTYQDPVTNCVNSVDNTITVNPLPVVTFAGTFPPLCSSSTTFNLSSGTPAGGTYSGPGVTGTNFNASIAGVGTHVITYTYTDINGCTNSATNTIVVNPSPIVTWTTILPLLCEDNNNFILTGGLPAGGIYGGPGVIGNIFNPALVGPGTYTLTYTYTDITSGCTGVATNTVTVNALPVITWAGALADLCIDAAPVVLSGALPVGGTYSGTGVVGGVFDPALAGAGNFIITYTYTDPVTGCTNTSTKNQTVNPLPVVTFTGSFPILCSSSTTFNLSTGSPAGGTYSGPGVTGTNFNASVAGVGTHTLTYTYTDPVTGCTNFATNTITVSNAQTVTWLGALPSVCVNNTNVALSGGLPVGGIYSGPGVMGNVFNASITGPGTFTLTYTFTDNATGCTGSATNTITVYPLPVVTFDGSLPNQCITSTSFTLTGGLPLGGTYSGIGVLGNSFNATVAGIGTHVITYTYTDINGCINSATNTITVVNLPIVTFNTALADLCITSTSYTLTGGSPAGGVYSGAGVTGTNFNASVAGVGTHVITYTYTDINGCVNSATNTITVHALPSVTFGGTLVPQCVSSTTYLLTGGLPGGGTYSGPGVSGNNFNASVAGVGLHTITYTYTDGYGCTNSATNTINVLAVPVVTWTTALTQQCETATSYLLSGGTPAGGVYSGPGVNGTNFNAALVGPGTYTLTYTYTDVNGCSGFANNTIVVNALPNVVWNTVLAPQCVTTTAYVLTGGTPAGGTYSGPGVTGNTFSAASVGVGTYTLTYTYTDPVTGCTNFTTNTITVQNLPAVFFPGILPAQCVSSTNLALNTGVPAGGTYSGPGVVGNNFNASVAGVGTWTLTYTYTNAAGCTNSATNTVTVNPLPNVTWTNTLTQQCAANTTYALTGGLPLGGVYSGPGVTGSNFNASVVGVGTYTLTYTYTDGNGCVNTANNTITVVAMPTVDLGPDQGVCFGTTTTLTATATPLTVTYLWNTSATTQSISVIAGDTTTYSVTVTTTDGCTASDSVVIIPLPLPIAGAVANPITICAGESTIVSASGGSGLTPYLWNTSSTLQTFVTGPLTDTTYYTVTVMNTYGCTSIATVRVNVNMIPIVSLGPDIIACENYTVTLSPTGSTPFDNFLWNNGLETPTIDVDSTGYGLNNPATWTVTVTLNGCQAKDAIIVTFVPCPGYEELGKEEKIVVYPNPTDGQFTVTIENYDKPLNFDIYNNIGQLLYSEKLQNNSNAKYSKDFDLSRYPTGFYILRFTDGDKVRSKKLIVK